VAEHAEAIRALGKQTIASVIEIGRRLTECKTILGHGKWLPWLEREFGWAEQSARNFMAVHAMSLKSPTVGDLNLDMRSLYLIAAPSTPAEVRDEVIERAKSGEKVTHAEVKRAVAEAQPTATRKAAPVRPVMPSPAASKQTSPASVATPKRATASNLRDCWDRAPPDERQRFVDGVSLRALFDAAPIDQRETFRKRLMTMSAQPDDDIRLLGPTEPVAAVVKAANSGMPDVPQFLRRTKPAPAEDIAEPEEAA
jgi:hypothetical protein